MTTFKPGDSVRFRERKEPTATVRGRTYTVVAEFEGVGGASLVKIRLANGNETVWDSDRFEIVPSPPVEKWVVVFSDRPIFTDKEAAMRFAEANHHHSPLILARVELVGSAETVIKWSAP